VARTKHLAKIASQVAKPDGMIVVDPATELDFLHPLPVDLVWGIGPVTRKRLAEKGIATIGQLAARMAKALGAGAVYGTEKTASRLDLARDVIDEVIDVDKTDSVERIMELTHGRGADVVLECAGSVSSTQQSVAVARKGGTIVVVGICFDWVQMPISEIVLKGLTLKGVVCFSVGDFASALDLVARRKIDVDPLVTRKYALDDIHQAFEAASLGEGGKILVGP